MVLVIRFGFTLTHERKNEMEEKTNLPVLSAPKVVNHGCVEKFTPEYKYFCVRCCCNGCSGDAMGES